MGINEIYPRDLEPIAPDATDLYLRDLPPQSTLGIPEELATRPRAFEAYIRAFLDRGSDSVRKVEVGYHDVSYRASVCSRLMEGCPDLVDSLPDELRSQVHDLAARLVQEP